MLKKIVLAAALAVLGLANLAGTDAEANGYTGYGWRHGHVVSFKKNFHGYGHGHGYGHKVYVPQHKAYGYGHNVYGFQHKPAFWFSYGHNRRWH